jgi:hypothetical protein
MRVSSSQRCRWCFAAFSLLSFQDCTTRAARAQRRSATRRCTVVMRARRRFGSRASACCAQVCLHARSRNTAGQICARTLRELDPREPAPCVASLLHPKRAPRGLPVRRRQSKRATPRSTPNSYIDIPKSTPNPAAAPDTSRWLRPARQAANPLQKAAVCGEASPATKVTAVLASRQLATFPHRVFVKISDRGAFDKPHATTTRRTSTHRSSTGIKSPAHGFTLRAALLHHGSARLLHITRMRQS